MYICPICKKEFAEAELVAKHSLACWKAQNPNHKSKPAPRSPDINEREDSSDILNFFASFKGE